MGSADHPVPTEDRPKLYLLFEHHAFLEKSDNVEWHLALLEWQHYRMA
jgi:hypothetical protein